MRRRIVIASVLCLLHSPSFSSPIDQSPECRSDAQQDKYSSYENEPSPLGFALTILHCNRDDVTAGSTVVIALFTIILGIYTTSLAYSTRKVVALATDEFVSTHRPELIIREVTWAMIEDAKPSERAIAYTIVNRGRSGCTLIESVFVYSDVSGNGQAIRTNGVNTLGPITFEPGQFRTFSYRMSSAIQEHMSMLRVIGRMSEPTYFRGSVIYADRIGIKRRSVFTRRCDPGTFPESDRFHRTDDPEDEYTD